LILFGAIYGPLACRLVSARRMTDDYIWLRGVNREFLNRLEVWGLSSIGHAPIGYAPPGGVPAEVPAKQIERQPSLAPPFWLWGSGLFLAAAAMLIAVLKVLFSVDPTPIVPGFLIAMFALFLALFVWAISTQWRRIQERHGSTDNFPPRLLTTRGVFIEHPVVGALAIFLLLLSVSTATYLLTAAWSRRTRSDPPSTPNANNVVVDGWTQLFNGRDLSGWKPHPDEEGVWKVEGGELIGSGGTSYLFSERGDYEDFQLRVEAKISDGGESGVYFRVPTMKLLRYGAFPEGYEANINSTHPIDEERTGSLTGSLRGVVHYKTALHKPEEWFTMEVIARGQHIQIKVNGQTTIDFVDANNSFRRGHLALQDWLSDSEVRFRTIELKELRPAEENVDK
jgi:hypothetical protein